MIVHDIIYNCEGDMVYESYTENELLHRLRMPAMIEYYENGYVSNQIHFNFGKFHRVDGPAKIEYFESGNIWYETYILNGKVHRENLPAYIVYHIM